MLRNLIQDFRLATGFCRSIVRRAKRHPARSTVSPCRSLRVEPLEQRQLLAATSISDPQPMHSADDFFNSGPVIEGFVWHDLNHDGRQDDGEPGIEGVSVGLFEVDGLRQRVGAFTDADGRFSMYHPHLSRGKDVYLEFGDLPDGFTFTGQNFAEDGAVDSDVDRYTGRTYVFTVPGAIDQVVIDAGLQEWTVPNRVREFSASAASGTQVELTWGDTGTETGYRIYQWDHELGHGVLVATLPRNSRSHSVENLDADQRYFFSLEAFNPGGSSWSVWQAVRTLNVLSTPDIRPEMSEPSVLVADSSSQITVSWSSAEDADGYRVYQWNGEKGALIASLSSDATSHVVTGLPAGARQFFTVEAFNDGGSDFTTWNSVSTPLRSIKPVTFSGIGSGVVTVNWFDAGNEDGYRVYQWNAAQGRGTLVAPLSSDATSVTIVNLASGTTHFFSVEAFNTNGSTWSSWRSVSTHVVKP
jgi:fibronectin type 3 domain-containing protein